MKKVSIAAALIVVSLLFATPAKAEPQSSEFHAQLTQSRIFVSAGLPDPITWREVETQTEAVSVQSAEPDSEIIVISYMVQLWDMHQLGPLINLAFRVAELRPYFLRAFMEEYELAAAEDSLAMWGMRACLVGFMVFQYVEIYHIEWSFLDVRAMHHIIELEADGRESIISYMQTMFEHGFLGRPRSCALLTT